MINSEKSQHQDLFYETDILKYPDNVIFRITNIFRMIEIIGSTFTDYPLTVKMSHIYTFYG